MFFLFDWIALVHSTDYLPLPSCHLNLSIDIFDFKCLRQRTSTLYTITWRILKKSWLLKFLTIDVLSEKKVCKANEFIKLSWGFLAPEAISQGWQNIRRYWNFSCPVEGITGSSEIINHSSTSNRREVILTLF